MTWNLTNTKKVVGGVVAAVTVSLAGIGLIAKDEGKRNVAYPDVAHGWALPTICYGHTKGVRRGQTATDEQCILWLREDAGNAAKDVLRVVKVPLSQSELDAYTSFVFNVGIARFQSSTMLKLLNSGNRTAACHQLIRWVYADGKLYQGLVTRREREQELCLSGAEQWAS